MKPLALATLACLATALLTATATAQLPPGAPPGTYNASATTSGAFTGDDSLYAGNAGFFSRRLPSGTRIISYKLITVKSRSLFWGVTGNASMTDGAIFDVEWQLTVDSSDPTQATAEPLVGSIANKELSRTDFIDRGNAFYGTTGQEYDLLLTPFDGLGFALDPGDYYVSVWVTRTVSTFEFLWSELSTTGVQPDVFFADALHSPGESTFIQGISTLGGQTMQTGNLAFDVWMTPLASACAGDCDGSGVVDFNDLVAMLFEFGEPDAPDACDADASGAVDFNDLVTALFAFGACP